MTVARRTWPQLKAETIRRLRGIDAPGFDLRVEQWLNQALLDLSTTLHHFELDSASTLTLSTASNNVLLPAGTFIVIGAPQLREPGTGAVDTNLVFQDYRTLEASYVLTAGQPRRWSRFGLAFYVDVLPQAAYQVNLFYYAYPPAPDFTPASSAVSPLGIDTDEYVMQRALALAWPQIDRPDLGKVAEEAATTWAQSQVRPLLRDKYLTEMKEQLTAGSSLGGAQG